MRAPPADWILRGDPFHANGKGRGHAFPAILEHLIRQRGLPAGEDLEGFLRPKLRDLGDPFLIPEMRDAVTTTWTA
jgi:single-stranded-DNA-specific exonuclease